MKIKVQKIIRPLELGEYARELEGQSVEVWVNPTRNVLEKMDSLDAKSVEWINKIRDSVPKDGEDRTDYQKLIDRSARWHEKEYIDGLFEWFALIWSQGEDKEKHWTAEECRELDKADPALLGWLREGTRRLIKEHRAREKKS